jgi:hypothetical protein
MASHAGFLRPGQPGYAAHLGHTPTPEDSSGSPTGGRHHLEAPIRGAGLRCQPVGLSFGGSPQPQLWVIHPVVPRPFLDLTFGAAVKYVFIYVYTYRYFIKVMRNSCHYTLSPHVPNHSEVGSWGLS